MFCSALYGEDLVSNPSLHMLWFLGHACSSYTSMGSVLDVMDYGLAKDIWLSNELTARMLLILRIIALGLLLQ